MFWMQMGRMGQTGSPSWLRTLYSLFANSEKGIAKLDFSDFTGMYQDRARTIPYTAVEQPLGSFTGLNGVTATAPADVNRGVVSARVNLLEQTGSLNVSPWTATGAATASGNVISFNGADESWAQYITTAAGVGASFTFSVELSGSGTTYIGIARSSGGVYEFGTKKVTLSAEPTRHSFTYVIQNAGQLGVAVTLGSGSDGTATTVTTDKASLVYTSDAHLPYQRVNTPTDYDTAGFPHYLKFNGTNTTYVTPSIDFTGTDKMTVWAGVETIGSGVQSILALSENPGANPNSFWLERNGAAPGVTRFASRGSEDFGSATLTYSDTAVIVGQGDITAPLSKVEEGGASNTSVVTQGSGNYGNYPIYIGALVGGAYPVNGSISSLIVRGAQSSLSQIEAVENLIRKTMRLP